jgi:hypothetical protein
MTGLLVVSERKPNRGGNEHLSTEVVVALISVFGVVVSALIGNWDKIFRASPESGKPGITPAQSSESIHRDEKGAKVSAQRYLEDLGKYLSIQDYKSADKETRLLMLSGADRTQAGWIDQRGADKLSCSLLLEIDALWRQYSKDRFGFGVQRSIFENTRRNTEEFGRLVGWRKNGQWISNSNLEYSLKAPPGHLPSTTRDGSLSGGWLVYPILFNSRLGSCTSNAKV